MKVEIDYFKTPSEIKLTMPLDEFCAMYGALYANHHAVGPRHRVRVEADVYAPLAEALASVK